MQASIGRFGPAVLPGYTPVICGACSNEVITQRRCVCSFRPTNRIGHQKKVQRSIQEAYTQHIQHCGSGTAGPAAFHAVQRQLQVQPGKHCWQWLLLVNELF